MQELFFQFVGVSITTSIFIILLFILSPVIQQRYRVKWRYFIWLFLAFRLLLPVNFGITEPPVEIDIPNIGISYNSPANSETREASRMDQVAGDNQAIVQGQNPGEIGHLEGTWNEGQLLPPGAIKDPEHSFISLGKILTMVYFTGVTVFLLGQFVLYLSFAKATRRWYQPVENSHIITAFEEMKKDLYLTSPLGLKLCKKVTSPMITGLIRPTLLLPHEDYEGADLTFVLKHELTHFRRNDLWFKLLLLLVQGFHWYNPLVHLMVREANKDIEMACDEEVLKDQSGDTRKQYTERILALMEVKGIHDPPISTNFHGGKHMMRDRIRSILDEEKKRRGIFAIAFLMVVVVLGSACKIQALENLQISMTGEYVKDYTVDLDGDGMAETTFQLESNGTNPDLFLAAKRDWKRLDVVPLFQEVTPEEDYGFQAANMAGKDIINFLVFKKEAENTFGGGRWAFYSWKNGRFQKKSLDPVTENLQAHIISFADAENNVLQGGVLAWLKEESNYVAENPVVAFYFENQQKSSKGPKAIYYAPLSAYDLEGYKAWGEEALSKAMTEMKLVKGQDIADLLETPADNGNWLDRNDKRLGEKIFLQTKEVIYISLPKTIVTITSYYALENGSWVYVTGQIE